jgi:xanthine/CO dehydrogenase XdhC/CoxF family maturation factor
MSHSFEQDSRVLAALLAGGVAVSYLGVLGPQRRTQELLAEAAALAGYTQELIPEQAEEWLTRLHAPTGLDLGAESPETVALSIVAEIQKVLAGATALPLREVRAVQAPQEADPIAASAASSAL